MARAVREPPEGVRLGDAYADLTREAFAVWIRLSIEDEHTLREMGVGKMALVLKYKKRGFYDILCQLRNKGYVRYRTPKLGERGRVHLSKRPMLVGYDQFLKLS